MLFDFGRSYLPEEICSLRLRSKAYSNEPMCRASKLLTFSNAVKNYDTKGSLILGPFWHCATFLISEYSLKVLSLWIF